MYYRDLCSTKEENYNYYLKLLDLAYRSKCGDVNAYCEALKMGFDAIKNEQNEYYPQYMYKDIKIMFNDSEWLDDVMNRCICRILESYKNEDQEDFFVCYKELGEELLKVKHYNKDDSSYRKVQEIISWIYCKYIDGKYQDIEKLVPNLGKLIEHDRDLMKKIVYHYTFVNMEGTVNYRASQNRINLMNGDCNNGSKKENVDSFCNYILPIIYQINGIKDCNKVNGYNVYNVSYNDTDLYVYQGYGSLIISREELEWYIQEPLANRYNYLGGSKGTYCDILLPNIKSITNDSSNYIVVKSYNSPYLGKDIGTLYSSSSVEKFFKSLEYGNEKKKVL